MVENFLPACQVCNRLRWHYRPDEIKEILQIGIYARTEIRHKTELGKEIGRLFVRHIQTVNNRRQK